jgi:hypothetical protein
MMVASADSPTITAGETPMLTAWIETSRIYAFANYSIQIVLLLGTIGLLLHYKKSSFSTCLSFLLLICVLFELTSWILFLSGIRLQLFPLYAPLLYGLLAAYWGYWSWHAVRYIKKAFLKGFSAGHRRAPHPGNAHPDTPEDSRP